MLGLEEHPGGYDLDKRMRAPQARGGGGGPPEAE